MILRPATASDGDAVWEIFRAVVAPGDTYTFDPQTTRESALAWWFAPGTHAYVGESDGRAVGIYLLRPNQPALGAHVANAAFMVSPTAQGLGVGRRMGEHCLAEARRLGFRAMQFNFVVSTNAAAVRLWRQLGFEIVGTLPGAFRHPRLGFVDAYVMFRNLDAPARRPVVVIDAPSNLGLTPPAEGVAPGCYKMPWALRSHGLLAALAAEDGGVVIPPRYQPDWQPHDGPRNAAAIAEYSGRLADRLAPLLARGDFPVVLGGDCSILLGGMLALRRRGRHGLVFLDAHSDFRHLGNSPVIRAAAGEDLAIATGRGDARLTKLEDRKPLVRDEDVHVVGVRAGDDHLAELAQHGIRVTTSADLKRVGAAAAAAVALETVTRSTDGFWVHLDVDVVDSSEMPAADCPEPDGPSFALLGQLLGHLVRSPSCVGLEVTIYDPDLDPSGAIAGRVVRCLAQAFAAADAMVPD